jgi:hypothetical protein
MLSAVELRRPNMMTIAMCRVEVRLHVQRSATPRTTIERRRSTGATVWKYEIFVKRRADVINSNLPAGGTVSNAEVSR